MTDEKVGAIVQARMGSTRLPGKVLRTIGGSTLLGLVIDRIKDAKTIDEIIIATTKNPDDDEIVNFCKSNNIQYYRGSESDVLKRHIEAADKYDLDIVARIASDNPFATPKVIDKLVQSHLEDRPDYSKGKNLPLGAKVEVINTQILKRVYRQDLKEPDKEHVTYFIKRNQGDFDVNNVDFHLDDEIRLTVDTEDDLTLLRKLAEELGPISHTTLKDAVSLLKQNPELKSINVDVEQKKPARQDTKEKISVIIRTYNSEEYVEDAIKSALNQTLNENFYEVLVIDDGSQDNTLNIVENFSDKIRIISKEHTGPIPTLNEGVKSTKGKYVILLDSDDFFEPSILAKLFKKIEGKNVGFVFCDYYEINTATDNVESISLEGNMYHSLAAGILIEKKLLEKIGFYDESLIFPEYDVLANLQNITEGAYINEALYNYRRHDDSLTSSEELVRKGKRQLEEKYGKEFSIREY